MSCMRYLKSFLSGKKFLKELYAYRKLSPISPRRKQLPKAVLGGLINGGVYNRNKKALI